MSLLTVCGLVFVQEMRQKQEVLIQTLMYHRVEVPFVEPRVSFAQCRRLSSQYVHRIALSHHAIKVSILAMRQSSSA